MIDNYFISSSWLRGIKRVKGNSCAQKLPIRIDLLYHIWHQLNLRCSFQASFWAICLTAFFVMFHKSNFLPISRSSFDPNKQLTKADFVFESSIQFREKVVLIPFSYVPHSPLCPVQAIRHAFSFLPSDMDCSQAFNYLDTQTLQPVCFIFAKFLKFLRSCLENIGSDPTSYAGHSFCHGGASFAFQSGIPVEMIKLLGDWKSDAVLLYLTVPIKMQMESNNFLTKSILQMYGH